MMAAFVALALCIPLIGVIFAARIMVLMNRFGGGDKGDKGDKGGKGGNRPPSHLPPLGGNPYHLP